MPTPKEWKELKQECDFYRKRIMLLECEKYRMREPELTLVCDILANGALLPDRDGSRYGKVRIR